MIPSTFIFLEKKYLILDILRKSVPLVARCDFFKSGGRNLIVNVEVLL